MTISRGLVECHKCGHIVDVIANTFPIVGSDDVLLEVYCHQAIDLVRLSQPTIYSDGHAFAIVKAFMPEPRLAPTS